MKWALVTMAVFGYLLSDRLPLMQHDSEAVKAKAIAVKPASAGAKPTKAEPVILRPAHGYSDSDRKALDRLVVRSMREAEKREKAQQIAALWNITPENINAHEEWW